VWAQKLNFPFSKQNFLFWEFFDEKKVWLPWNQRQREESERRERREFSKPSDVVFIPSWPYSDGNYNTNYASFKSGKSADSHFLIPRIQMKRQARGLGTAGTLLGGKRIKNVVVLSSPLEYSAEGWDFLSSTTIRQPVKLWMEVEDLCERKRVEADDEMLERVLGTLPLKLQFMDERIS